MGIVYIHIKHGFAKYNFNNGNAFYSFPNPYQNRDIRTIKEVFPHVRLRRNGADTEALAIVEDAPSNPTNLAEVTTFLSNPNTEVEILASKQNAKDLLDTWKSADAKTTEPAPLIDPDPARTELYKHIQSINKMLEAQEIIHSADLSSLKLPEPADLLQWLNPLNDSKGLHLGRKPSDSLEQQATIHGG